jgi:hypothetical protein
MTVEVKVDATRALARFSPAGIPEQVRANLRNAIPPLMRELTARIDSNLAVLKSRTHLQIKGGPQGEMVENAEGITGVAEMGWTGDARASMVPEVLESGSKEYVIRGNPVLAFPWPNAPIPQPKGGIFFFRQVTHKATTGIHYMENAFNSMRAEIIDKITAAVQSGTKE